MVFRNKICVIFVMVLLILHDCETQLRITNGTAIPVYKPYMAYLVQSPATNHNYDNWLCGGTIVTSRSIITSAACIEDVQYMYAVAGYNYTDWKALDKNGCTRLSKKKVVTTCVPKRYDFAYHKIERWSSIDVGVVKVESPFDFTKTIAGCNHAPGKIRVNFDEKWQAPGTDAFVMGYGSVKLMRQHGDTNSYNTPTLMHTTTVIVNKEECKRKYSSTPQLYDIIDRYMLCADGPGKINLNGEIIEEVPRVAEGCDPTRRDGYPESCELDENGRLVKKHSPYKDFRRSAPNRPTYGEPSPASYSQPYYSQPNSYGTSPAYDKPSPSKPGTAYPPQQTGSPYTSRTVANNSMGLKEQHAHLMNSSMTRKHGICQNDHGGPLVSWIGTKEVLIGVASVFRINENNECIGPYLYTSTQCNSAFLNCILSEDKDWGEKELPATIATTTKPTTAKPTTKKPTPAKPTTKKPTPAKPTTKKAAPAKPTTKKPTPKPPTKKPKRKQFYRYSRTFCNLPPEQRGFDMIRRQISWANHPDGPAANEHSEDVLTNFEIRPQIPMSAFGVLALECAVTDKQAKADDSNYSYSNNLIIHVEKVHGVPQSVRNDFKAYLDTMKASYHDKKSIESGEVNFRKRLFKTIKKMFKKKEANPRSTSTTTSAPLNEGLFKRVTTTTSAGFMKTEEANWLKTFDEHGNNSSGKESKVPDIFNDKDATGNEFSMDLTAKSDEISSKNTNKEILRTPYGHISTEDSDLDYVEATRYKREVDNIENIPVEVKPLSVQNNSTENKQNATKTKPNIKIKRHITNTKSKIGKPIEMRIKIKKDNELPKKVPVNLPNIDIHNLTLGEILSKIKKGNSSYVDNIAHVNANVSDGQVNDSRIFKIRVKRKVNDTHLNVLGQAFKPNATSKISEAITHRSKISNATKADVENTTSSYEDHIQEKSENCNESKPLNGRRSYNREDDGETASEVKHKLLQYMEETFTEIFSKIQPLEEIKRSFGTQDMYRMGYIVANIDTLDTNLRNLKTELESNRDLWSDRKIMDIFDKIMTTNKIVSNLLTALQAFTLHETSSVRPLVPFGPNYFPTQQPDRIY